MVIILMDPEMSAWQVIEALGRGVITGMFMRHMCAMKTLGPIISKVLVGVGLVNQWEGIMEAAKAGDWDDVATRSVQFVFQLISMHQNCFTGDTLVSTEDGQKRIDEIEVDDKVWAYNVETGETELKEVTKVYIHETDELLHLYTSVGTIDTTSNHPFYVVGKGWVAAGDLVSGDKIYQLDGTIALVTGSQFEKLDVPVKVYNLEVEDFHSYFVGDVPVLVHNYISQSGNDYPENQDYSYIDPNSGDYLFIHNTHPHGGVQPHTHYPETNIAPDGTIYYNKGPFSSTDYEDYELLDFAITVLGWIKNPKGAR